MRVILKKDIEKLGKAGEVVTVKPGYGRNFLLPQDAALAATEANLKLMEQEKARAHFRQEKEKKEAEALAAKISSISCTIPVAVGPDGKLYGSVTTQDIAQAYKLEGIDIDKRKIELPQAIKEVGVFKINIKVHPELNIEAKVWVVKE
ncbi:MAG: 50S ribosomal protein L9 [Candidatus Omnitrophota bacterium]|nr:MAG: 50S ribosomal protein L9 [Candidatus Omnitrophota bacterium]